MSKSNRKQKQVEETQENPVAADVGADVEPPEDFADFTAYEGYTDQECEREETADLSAEDVPVDTEEEETKERCKEQVGNHLSTP